MNSYEATDLYSQSRNKKNYDQRAILKDKNIKKYTNDHIWEKKINYTILLDAVICNHLFLILNTGFFLKSS